MRNVSNRLRLLKNYFFGIAMLITRIGTFPKSMVAAIRRYCCLKLIWSSGGIDQVLWRLDPGAFTHLRHSVLYSLTVPDI